MRNTYFLILAVCLFLFTNCKKSDETTTTGNNTTTDSTKVDSTTSKYHIIGCYTTWTWNSFPIEEVPLDKLTDLYICFAWPEADGSLNTSDIKNIDHIVSVCKAKNVKVILNIGGAAKSAGYPLMASTKERRTKFINEALKYAKDHKLDGFSIDWEHWPTPETVDATVSANILALFKEFYAELKKEALSLSYDVFGSDWYGKHYPKELIDHADVINIMAFDAAGAWSPIGHHSPASLITSSYNYWLGRIGAQNAHKVSFAVPFYGYQFDKSHTAGSSSTAKGIGYNEILKDHPEAYENDTVQNASEIIIHNGIKTYQQKIATIKANKAKGIVIWELNFDKGTGDKSLLDFIHKEFNKE